MRFVFRLNEEMWNNVKQGDDVLLARKHVAVIRSIFLSLRSNFSCVKQLLKAVELVSFFYRVNKS